LSNKINRRRSFVFFYGFADPKFKLGKEAILFSSKYLNLMKELFQSVFVLKISKKDSRKKPASFGSEVIGFIKNHRKTGTPAYYWILSGKVSINQPLFIS